MARSIPHVAFLRVKENLEYLQNFAKKKIELATTQISRDNVQSVDCEEACDYVLMKSFYEHMKRILDREVKTANFFVERVHRAPWNLCDQYVSSIIEVHLVSLANR